MKIQTVSANFPFRELPEGTLLEWYYKNPDIPSDRGDKEIVVLLRVWDDGSLDVIAKDDTDPRNVWTVGRREIEEGIVHLALVYGVDV